MMTMQIANRTIASDQPVFVIAEIGVNHDGSVDRACDLVHAAAQAGADAVKLQIFCADRLMHASSRMADYQKERCAESEAIEMLRKYELSEEDFRRVVKEIQQKRMIPLATPFSPADVELVSKLDLPAIKIASPDLVNLPLLKKASELKKPMLLSTGAATLDEITTTVKWLNQWGTSFALLHCVSSYPTPPEKANLGWIAELSRRFTVPVGYSDHTQETMTGALAVATGAVILEKHLTYDRTATGPDHSASADPKQFVEYVQWVRKAELMRGQRAKCVLDIEQDVRTISRQSLVAARDIPAGQQIVEADLTVQRPGTGIPAAEMDAVVGRKAMVAITIGTFLKRDMLSEK